MKDTVDAGVVRAFEPRQDRMKLLRAALRRLEHVLIRAGFIATPEESEYYAWADSRLDELEQELRLARKRETDQSWNGHTH